MRDNSQILTLTCKIYGRDSPNNLLDTRERNTTKQNDSPRLARHSLNYDEIFLMQTKTGYVSATLCVITFSVMFHWTDFFGIVSLIGGSLSTF